jgi:hypothetical protein
LNTIITLAAAAATTNTTTTTVIVIVTASNTELWLGRLLLPMLQLLFRQTFSAAQAE